MKAKITVISVCALVLMGLALAPTPADTSVVKEGLVGYWTFDTVDVKGKTVKDAVGANDGTIDGSPTQTKGKVGQALRLGGLPEAVTVPSPADNSLNFGNDKDFTLMAWIQVSKEPEGGQSTIMSKGDGGGNNRFLLKVRDGGINLSLADDKPASVDIRSEGKVIDGKWHHILLSIDRDKETQLYIDGVKDPVGGNTSVATNLTSDTPLVIGASNKPDGSRRRYFEGLIDEVAIYNRALNEREIKQNATATDGLAVNPLGKLSLTWGGIKSAQ